LELDKLPVVLARNEVEVAGIVQKQRNVIPTIEIRLAFAGDRKAAPCSTFSISNTYTRIWFRWTVRSWILHMADLSSSTSSALLFSLVFFFLKRSNHTLQIAWHVEIDIVYNISPRYFQISTYLTPADSLKYTPKPPFHLHLQEPSPFPQPYAPPTHAQHHPPKCFINDR